MENIKLSLPGNEDYFTQEAYKVLRTNVQFCGQDIKVIALTSYNENEGKTTIALHLGRSLSELGKKVLVIDADMRKSVMAGRNANAKAAVGLSEVLSGLATAEEATFATQYPNLRIIFSGKYPPNPVELLGGKYFAALIEQQRKSYDYILIDTPPLGRVIDAAVAANCCDGTLLVIGDSKLKNRQAQEVVAQLQKGGSRILGVVINKLQTKGKAYYYARNGRYKNSYSGKYGANK